MGSNLNVNPDFSEAIEGIEPGTYAATIDDVSEENAKETGTPFLKWTLKAKSLDREFTVFHNTPVTGKGAGILKEFMKAAYPEYEGGTFNARNVLGREVKLRMGKDQNSRYLRVVEVLAA